MALKQELEELIATLPEEDRDATRGILEKHESLRGGYLRQSDYDRLMNEAKTNQQTWQDWYDRNKGKHEKLSEEFKTLSTQKAELESQLKLAQAAGGDVDIKKVEEAIEERLKGKGYVSKEELATIVADETKKALAEKEKELVEKTLPAYTQLNLRAVELMSQHQAEFGKPLNRDELAKFMREKGINGLDEAFNQFVGPQREAKKIEEARNEGEKKGREEAAKNNIPGSVAAPMAPELGPVAMLQQNKGPEIPEGVRVGSGQLAALAGAELRAEGKIAP